MNDRSDLIKRVWQQVRVKALAHWPAEAPSYVANLTHPDGRKDGFAFRRVIFNEGARKKIWLVACEGVELECGVWSRS